MAAATMSISHHRLRMVIVIGNNAGYYIDEQHQVTTSLARRRATETAHVGQRILRARASLVTDRDEAAKALYMFRKNSPLYDNVFSSMSSVEKINFLTLGQVANQFTIVRFDPEIGEFEIPPLPQLPTWALPVGSLVVMALLVARRMGRKRGQR